MQAVWDWLVGWFHRFGSPRWFFLLTGRWLPWLSALAVSLLVVGCGWGLAFAPEDYQQHNTVRIMYVHVPTAILAQSIYMMMGAAALVLLVWRMKIADWFIATAAPIGASMTALALFSGGVWGRPTWGAWWVWDGRTTSTLLQLFLYLGVISLRRSVPGEDRAGRAAAVLCLVGLPNIFIIKYSVVWWLSMHQVSSFTLTSGAAMPPSMYLPLLINVVGFYCMFAVALLLSLRCEILVRERRTQWVQDWVRGRR